MSTVKQIKNERLYKIILKPRISEKATIIAEKNRQFVFAVDTSANKSEVKRAVELLFKVEVDNVRVLNVKGKKKTFAQRPGRRKNWKKAYVTLKEGHDIDFIGVS